MSAATQLPLETPRIGRGDIRAMIASEVARACERRYSKRLCAVVLTGSLARDEATLLVENASTHILGDAEFLLVFRRRSAVPGQTELRALESSIAQSLRRQAVACPLHLAGVSPGYFRRLPAHIFSYELRSSGQVVFGDKEILGAIPNFRACDIEREDGWRLLSNRMIEWLEALAAHGPGYQRPDLALFYSTVKLWLDAATSLLVFLQAYAPSYRARAERLAQLAKTPPPDPPLPFSLRELSVGASAATSWKLDAPEGAAKDAGWAFCEQARRLAGALWCWESAQLTGLDPACAPLTFLRSSPRRRRQWRLWLRTARECARLRRQQPWRRWWKQRQWGSPRDGIYTVAAECLLRTDDFAPWAEDGLASELRAETLRELLPLPELPGEAAGRGWRRLVRELAWNYHVLIEKTRA